MQMAVYEDHDLNTKISISPKREILFLNLVFLQKAVM